MESKMRKFDFFLGTWNLNYKIPKSEFNETGSDQGVGSFKKVLNDHYVQFEYSTKSGSEAKGIFCWDNKSNAYKYYWFENSGAFQTATCDFINDETLAMNWHDTLLVQSFVKAGPNKIILKMLQPGKDNEYELILEVEFTRK